MKYSLITEQSKKIRHSGGKYIEGIFTSAEVKNDNGRIYSKKLLEREVQKYQEKIKQSSALGELGHPENVTINLDKVAILVESLKWRGNDVYGKAKILSTPNGKILESLINDGVKFGISSRGIGTVDEKTNYVDESSYKLLTFDIVDSPSNPTSWVNGILENRRFSLCEAKDALNERFRTVDVYQNNKGDYAYVSEEGSGYYVEVNYEYDLDFRTKNELKKWLVKNRYEKIGVEVVKERRLDEVLPTDNNPVGDKNWHGFHYLDTGQDSPSEENREVLKQKNCVCSLCGEKHYSTVNVECSKILCNRCFTFSLVTEKKTQEEAFQEFIEGWTYKIKDKSEEYLTEQSVSPSMLKNIEKFIGKHNQYQGGHYGYNYNNERCFYANIIMADGTNKEVILNLKTGKLEWVNESLNESMRPEKCTVEVTMLYNEKDKKFILNNINKYRGTLVSKDPIIIEFPSDTLGDDYFRYVSPRLIYSTLTVTYRARTKNESLDESVKVGEYYIPTYGLTGNLKDAHLKYFEHIIKTYGKLSKNDDIFQLKKAWIESMKVISDEKWHYLLK